jgi:hypothetical protein
MSLDYLANIKGYHDDVWFDEHAIANVLSKKWLSRQYRCTMNTRISDDILVPRKEVNELPDIVFVMHPSGLRYWDPTLSKRQTNGFAPG